MFSMFKREKLFLMFILSLFIFFYVLDYYGVIRNRKVWEMTEKFSRTFTLSKRVWDFLNMLKLHEQKNISAYVNTLIMKDIEKREENTNNAKQ